MYSKSAGVKMWLGVGERTESKKKSWAVDEAGLFGYTEFFSRLAFFFSSGASVMFKLVE